MKLPNEISYEQLDHEDQEFPAFSPDYNINDIGNGLDLTVTLFGHQLDSNAVETLFEELANHLMVDTVNKILNARNRV